MDQVVDWLNENELRAYPLLEDADKSIADGIKLPDSFLLDLQLVSYTEDFLEDPIVLKKIISHSIDEVEVVFGSDTLDLTSFHITNITSSSYPLYLRNPDGCLAVFGTGVIQLNQSLSAQTTLVTDIPVEPCTFTIFTGAWLGVQKILASPEKISNGNYTPLLPLQASQQQTVLTGDVVFMPGYNFRVGISNNLIDLEISEGYGLKMNCRTSFILPQYLDCSELVYSINGIFPDESGSFNFNPGSNIVITPGSSVVAFNDLFSENSNQHTLFVGLTFQTTDFCAPITITPLLS